MTFEDLYIDCNGLYGLFSDTYGYVRCMHGLFKHLCVFADTNGILSTFPSSSPSSNCWEAYV